MTKAEFVERIAGSFDSKKAAADAVDAVLGGIEDALAGGGRSTSPASASSASPTVSSPGRKPTHRRADHDRRGPRSEVLGRRRPEVQGQGRLTPTRPFRGSARGARRGAPQPGLRRPRSRPGRRRGLPEAGGATPGSDGRGGRCRWAIARAAPACVAAKLQLACFERLARRAGRPRAYGGRAREAGLLVIADGKRGDVPVSAAAYAQALLGSTPTPWGEVRAWGGRSDRQAAARAPIRSIL